MVKYAIIDRKKKIAFEKENHMPYGCSTAIICDTFKEALDTVESLDNIFYNTFDLVIEEYNSGDVYIVYENGKAC